LTLEETGLGHGWLDEHVFVHRGLLRVNRGTNAILRRSKTLGCRGTAQHHTRVLLKVL
jgi:hypothetical protein